MIKTYRISLEGKTYEVEIEELKEGSKPSPKIVQEPQNKAEEKKAVNNGSGEHIKAPMPGTIVGIKVNVGDHVTKGQVLVMLEAMKMENEIVAPVSGSVEAVNVSKGASVSAGDSLVTIK